MGMRCEVSNLQSAAVPATVSGECSRHYATGPERTWEGGGSALEPRVRRPAVARRSFAWPGPAVEPELSAAATRAAPRMCAPLVAGCAPMGTRRVAKRGCSHA